MLIHMCNAPSLQEVVAESHAGVEHAEKVQAELEEELAKERQAMARVSGVPVQSCCQACAPLCGCRWGQMCSNGGRQCVICQC